MTEYPDAPDADSLDKGQRYEDFIVAYAASRGTTITLYRTKREQIEIGESREGFEIKLDTPCTETGRLAVEVAEKTRRANADYVDSGIMRRDNTIWYIQGNYERAWLFWKARLVSYYRSRQPQTHGFGGTRRSFYLLIADADRLATRVADLSHFKAEYFGPETPEAPPDRLEGFADLDAYHRYLIESTDRMIHMTKEL